MLLLEIIVTDYGFIANKKLHRKNEHRIGLGNIKIVGIPIASEEYRWLRVRLSLVCVRLVHGTR
ncbi:MAG: hypothetical protein ACKO43_08010, partial [Alphaproteobacteria bacterium]